MSRILSGNGGRYPEAAPSEQGIANGMSQRVGIGVPLQSFLKGSPLRPGSAVVLPQPMVIDTISDAQHGFFSRGLTQPRFGPDRGQSSIPQYPGPAVS